MFMRSRGWALMLLGAACGGEGTAESAGTEGPSSTGVSDGESSASSSGAAVTEASGTSSSGGGTSGEMVDSSSGMTAAVTTGDDGAVCGDGLVEGGEACEDGNRVDTDHCTNACQFAVCGDGIEGPGEGCDDGNAIDDDQCTNECILISCGDGVIQKPEDCDEGVETAGCNLNCTASVCGDGIPNKKDDEDCDAGGQSPTCDDDCTVVVCGDGNVNATAGEMCDEGGESAACDEDCTPSACGDGVANASAGEDCDEGGESATCNADCSAAKCGDGVVNASAGEDCDEGAESASCDGDCTLPICGDGQVNAKAGEVCDDGNALFDDACSPLCMPTSVRIAPGRPHVCAIAGDKSVHCWGQGDYGQLGYGNINTLGHQPGELPTPVVAVGGEVAQLALGYRHSCARTAGGGVRCWGAGGQGQLGKGDATNLGDSPGELPTGDIALGVAALQVAAGTEHTRAIGLGGAGRGWGSSQFGQLGYGNKATLLKPDGADVPGIAGAVQIVAGTAHNCVLQGDDTVHCWGGNDYGQLGHGNGEAIFGDAPNEVPSTVTAVGDPGDPVVQLGAGYVHMCAVLASGKVRCWGWNGNGQGGARFGDANIGDAPGEMPPPDVDLGGPALQVTAGYTHSCALLASGKVKCWGQTIVHGYPMVGDIDSAVEFPPPDVALGGQVVSIAGHMGSFTCALLADQKVRCWGENNWGQLGLGHTNSVGDNETPGSIGPVPL